MTIVTQTKASLRPMTIAEHWNTLVPEYRSVTYPLLVMRVEWNPEYAELIEKISLTRAHNRFRNYVDHEELTRASFKLQSKGEASIRFGVSKSGHGYNGERGDFCLASGVIRGKNLTLFYRSLELIGGFAYDLTLIRGIQNKYFNFNTVTFIATKANVFALKGNSNEKLFPKLQRIFG